MQDTRCRNSVPMASQEKNVAVNNSPEVTLSGFGDETTRDKTFREQLAVFAGLGLTHMGIRFLDVGHGVVNAMQLEGDDLRHVVERLREYDMQVSSLASPLGKTRLHDREDGSANRFVPMPQYLNRDVPKACQLCQTLGTRFLRAFTFYPPRGSSPLEHLSEVVDRLGAMADICQREGITLGLEVEANLTGSNGLRLAEIHRRLNHDAVVLVFDAGNLAVQGYSPQEVFEHYLAVREGLGWLHIKDYQAPVGQVVKDHVDEEALNAFVPVGMGGGAHREIFADLRVSLPALDLKCRRRGAPGLVLELEPHLRGGGQFGGYSGPDGFGVGLRHLLTLLDESRIAYRCRTWKDIRPEADNSRQ